MSTAARHTVQIEVGGQRLRLTAASADPSHMEHLAHLAMEVNARVHKMQISARNSSPATLLALVSLDLLDESLAEATRSQKANEESLCALRLECERRVREAEEQARARVAEAEARARECEAAARLMAIELMSEIDLALALDDERSAREQKSARVGEIA